MTKTDVKRLIGSNIEVSKFRKHKDTSFAEVRKIIKSFGITKFYLEKPFKVSKPISFSSRKTHRLLLWV